MCVPKARTVLAGIPGSACYSRLPSGQEAGMQLCENCLSVTRDTSGAPGHPGLRIVDTRRSRIPGSVTVTISTFRCQECGAIWRYREAKDNGPKGWALVPDEGTGSE